MLLLGEPGTGKTTLLLELAFHLLKCSQQDREQPIPVILNLSSWSDKRSSLTEWLIDELLPQYRVPRHLGRVWIETDQLLLLLDGLDEVAESARPACVEAINAYHAKHFIPFVVCCRFQEYVNQEARLTLPGAVIVQPLTKEQINNYLGVGKSMDAVRAILQRNPALHDLVTTPLALNVVAATYEGKTSSDLPQSLPEEEQLQQIFTNYVERMLERQEEKANCPPRQTIFWLAWLAWQMQQRNRSTFFIEYMQPDWISEKRGQWLYELFAVRLPALLMSILISIVIGSFFIRDAAFTFPLRAALIGGFISELYYLKGTFQRPVGQNMSLWKQLSSRPIVTRSLRMGAILGLGIALSWMGQFFYVGQNYTWADWFRDGFFSGVIYGLNGVLISALVLSGLIERNTKEQQKEYLKYGVFIGLLLGVGGGLSVTLRGLFMASMKDALSVSFTITVSTSLIFGLVGICMGVFLLGRDSNIQPADIIVLSRHSLKQSLFNTRQLKNTMAVMFFLGLLWIGLLSVSYHNVMIGLNYGAFFGFSGGLIYWAVTGFFYGTSSDTFDEYRRVAPNEGIRRSVHNAIRMGSVIGLASGLSWFLSNFLDYVPPAIIQFGLSRGTFIGMNSALGDGVSQALFFGLAMAVGGGLLSGGQAAFKHGVLRIILWKNGSIPWNYPRFLDATAHRVLLHKIRGGYRFIHPSCQRYFCDLKHYKHVWPTHPT